MSEFVAVIIGVVVIVTIAWMFDKFIDNRRCDAETMDIICKSLDTYFGIQLVDENSFEVSWTGLILTNFEQINSTNSASELYAFYYHMLNKDCIHDKRLKTAYNDFMKTLFYNTETEFMTLFGDFSSEYTEKQYNQKRIDALEFLCRTILMKKKY